MKFKILISILLCFSALAQAQLTINSSTMSVSAGTIVSTNTDVIVQQGRLGGIALVLSGQDQSINSTSDLTLAGLGIAGGGIKTINGNVGIGAQFRLLNGIVDIPVTSNLILGASAAVSDYSEISYVNGRLNREQTAGEMIYPIGKLGTYTPITLSGVNGTGAIIAIEAFNDLITGVTPPDNIGNNYSQAWYWDLTVRNDPASFSSATITLPILDDDRSILSGDNYKPVVLHKDVEGMTLNLDNMSLAPNINDASVTAVMPAGVGSYFLGFEFLTTPIIHNIITPNDDGTNDYLTIDNLSLYPTNSVTLIDRYGVEVYSIENYVSPHSNSAVGEGEDFSFLPPGNYICILKYFDELQQAELTAKQTLSVIK